MENHTFLELCENDFFVTMSQLLRMELVSQSELCDFKIDSNNFDLFWETHFQKKLSKDDQEVLCEYDNYMSYSKNQSVSLSHYLSEELGYASAANRVLRLRTNVLVGMQKFYQSNSLLADIKTNASDPHYTRPAKLDDLIKRLKRDAGIR